MNNEEEFGRAIEHGISPRGNRNKWTARHAKLMDLPNREGFRKGRVGRSRRNGLGFPALDNMLQNGVGRPWANVYSEVVAKIKEEFDENCWHDLLSRLRWQIELNPMDVGDGQYVQANGHPFYAHSRHSLMVHPITGILMHPKKAWCEIKMLRPGERRNWNGEQTFYWGGLYFRKIKGIWHEVELEHVPKRPPEDYRTSTGRYSFYRPRDEDWLYKMNLRDAVIHTRIYSDMLHDLARCHGYKKYNGKIISHVQYEAEVAKALKSRWYGGCIGTPMICQRYVYAKAAWPISKSRMRAVGIPVGPQLTLPNIVG